MNGKKSPGGEDWPGRDQQQPETAGEQDDGGSEEQAMEQAQEEAAEERESEGGYQ